MVGSPTSYPDLKSAWAGSNEHSPANKTIPNPTLKNTEMKDNMDLQDYQTKLSNNEKAQFDSLFAY